MSDRPDNNSTPATDDAETTEPPIPPTPEQPSEPTHSDSDPMDQLRSLLVGPERELLRQIKQRLDDLQIYARDVSRILPEAIDISTERDKRLADSLRPTVENAITDSVRKNPRTIADAIFPIMGPAIRKAIIDALSKMVQSLNQTLQFGLSPRALLWRLQAWRTGKSFAEVVMLNSLLYRVEQVFLIRANDGILLQHVAADELADADTQDGDMVSGMLTAITDFVQDSFQPDEGTALDSLKVGELNVWIERGPHAVLAVVVRGNAPLDLRDEMQSLIEQIHEEFSAELPDSNCDQSVFERCRPDLEALLREAKKRKGKPVLAWIVLAAIFGVIAWFMIAGAAKRAKWQDFLDRLDSEPGIVITHVESNDNRRTLRGLRDPLARPIAAVYSEVYGVSDPDDVPEHVVDDLMLKTFHATDAGIATRRATMLLQPPASVTLKVEAGALRIEGPASYDLIERARRLGPTVAGIDRVIEDNLVAADLASIVIADARQTLKPPAGVTLKYDNDNGSLLATGEAKQQWINEARVLAQSIQRVKRYDDRNLIATDLNDIVLADADRILSPPAGVTLSFDQGILTASGKATGKWINDARVLARTIPAVRQFRETNLTADDLDDLIMTNANRLLAPPDTVKLTLANGMLIAQGEATTRWIEDARLLARTLRDVQRFDDSQLKASDTDTLVLREALRVLKPPANVTVSYKDGMLKITGQTTQAWIRDASILARSVSSVTQVDATGLKAIDFDNAVLADANAKLQPPPTVTLTFVDGTLTAAGSSKQQWLDRATIVAPLIQHVDKTDLSKVVATDLEAIAFANIANTLRPPATVKLELQGRTVVATGKASHEWLINARRIAPSIKAVDGVDLSRVADADQLQLEAAVARLRSRSIFYADNSAGLPLAQARQLGQLIADARDIAQASKALGISVTINIVGHSDTQQENVATQLSQNRANEMLKEMLAQGIPSEWLTATGKGSTEPYEPKAGDPPYASSRRVDFQVTVQAGNP